MKTQPRENERRDSVIIIVLILLLGFICIIIASGWALRFAPSWKLNTNMGSNLDPNSDFLTSRPVSFIEPLDPAILTNPAWMDVFLTPGASSLLPTRTPLPASTATLVPMKTSTPLTTTVTATTVVNPTHTLIYFPPTITSTPRPPSTNTPITPITPTTATASVTPLPSADLQIFKTDGMTTYNPGGTLIYSVIVQNNGASAVTGAVVTDNKPAQVTSWAWACTSQTGGATGCNAAAGGTANFTDTVNLPNGASIVYTVTTNISAAATGNLVNTATITSGLTDPIPGNNTATDTDAPPFTADLGITKNDFVATYTPGGVPLTYTITVINNGPAAVTGAVVTDNFPTQITTWDWACASQTGGANGCTPVTGSVSDFADAINLPVGASVVYTVTANISLTATGNLTNRVDVAVPVGYTDPTLGNNFAIDTDTLNAQTDLAITKNDGSLTYTAGDPITYAIVVSNNAGSSNAIGASVTDAIPVAITGVTINCVASGTASCGTNASVGNNLSYTGVNITAGAGNFITIAVSGTVNPAATGNLSNTAIVIVGAGQIDPVAGNNSATDIDTPNLQTDLRITKDDGSLTYTAGNPISYTIVVSNTGPSNAIGASVADTIPAAITGTTINCVASGTASCGTNASAGNNLSYTGVNITAGAGNFLTFTVSGTVNPATTGNLTNTATVTAGAGQTDPNASNNTATDTNTQFIPPIADLQITKDDGVAAYTPGGTLTYVITVTNTGPSGVTGAVVTDNIPPQITTWDWNCTAQNNGAAGCDGVTGSAANFTDTVDLPTGASIVYTVTANIGAGAAGNLANTVTVTEPLGITDPNGANNSATDTDSTSLYGDIGTGRDDVIETLLPGSSITLTLSPQALVNGDVGVWDIIYYEQTVGSGIDMDRIILEVGNGSSWYTILNWGNGAPDVATNINTAVLGTCATEPDNCFIDASSLFNGTGVAIDLDSLGIPLGSYPFLRITVPGGSGNVGIDGIYIIVP